MITVILYMLLAVAQKTDERRPSKERREAVVILQVHDDGALNEAVPGNWASRTDRRKLSVGWWGRQK